jgi:DNA primase
MDAVSEVKARLNIEDVIGEYVQLKRSGRNFKGLSPWTNEKTPSFIVSPEKQIWHDFSSGKGGDMFSFVMDIEGLDFSAALEMLARKAGVDLEQFRGRQSGGAGKLKKQAQSALELAAKFYQKQLVANKTALDYLRKKRGFSKQTILDWRLGYAPHTSTALTDFLTKHGFTTDEMRAAGLITMRRAGASDMFRGRIMIPLADSRGAIVGFTARLLDEEDTEAPKYINTPQTMIYDKSRQVYGLHLAKEAIRKTGYVVVAEGNLDVIASHQAGVKNVVASAGTAMTEQHLKALKRFTGDVRLSFDADSAGIAATERVIPLAQKADVALRIITLVDAKDPDELIKKDSGAWQKAIDGAQYAPDWLVDRYQSQLDLKTAPGKKAFTDALLTTVRRLSDPVEQEHYLKKIAELTDSTLAAVKAKLESRPAEARVPLRKIKTQPVETLSRDELEYRKLADHFLAMALMRPDLRKLLDGLKPEYFNENGPREVFVFLDKNPKFKGEPKLTASLQGIGDYVKVLTLQFEELYAELPADELAEQAQALKRRFLARYVTIQKRILAEEMSRTADERKIKKLMEQADKLTELIK